MLKMTLASKRTGKLLPRGKTLRYSLEKNMSQLLKQHAPTCELVTSCFHPLRPVKAFPHPLFSPLYFIGMVHWSWLGIFLDTNSPWLFCIVPFLVDEATFKMMRMIAKSLSFSWLTGKVHDILERGVFRKPTPAYNEYIGINREN